MLEQMLSEPSGEVREAVARAASDTRVKLPELALAIRSEAITTTREPWNHVWFTYPDFRQAWVACATWTLRDHLTDTSSSAPADVAGTLTVLRELLAELRSLETSAP